MLYKAKVTLSVELPDGGSKDFKFGNLYKEEDVKDVDLKHFTILTEDEAKKEQAKPKDHVLKNPTYNAKGDIE